MTEVFDFRKPQAGPAEPEYELQKTVFFVGFMGAGKTSVARKLARNAGVASVDMDTFIERRCDMKVSEIFADESVTYKRARPRAQGRMYSRMKRTSHITVKVTNQE